MKVKMFPVSSRTMPRSLLEQRFEHIESNNSRANWIKYAKICCLQSACCIDIYLCAFIYALVAKCWHIAMSVVYFYCFIKDASCVAFLDV